jgi:hypothetical protein
MSNPKKANVYNKREGFFNSLVGSIELNTDITKDPSGSSVPSNNSFINIKDYWQSLIQLISGNIIISAVSNLSLYAAKHMNISVKGTQQTVIAGDKIEYVQGDVRTQYGKQGEEQKKAAKDLDDSNTAVQQKRIQAIQSTQGEKMPCPVCSTIHLVDHNPGALVDRIFSWLYKNIPFFCFPLDIVQKVLRAIIAPLGLSPTENISLTNGKGCGSAGCVNGQIESPLAGLKAADAATDSAMQEQADKVNSASIKLGSGGAKLFGPYKTDVMFKMGLKKNTVPAYTQKGHQVIAFALTNNKAGNALGSANLALDSTGSCKRIIYCEPNRTPGSIFFDTANNFTINAGTPGINLQTGGRVRIDAGDMVMTANQGEAVFGSGNLTTVKGKNIILAAQDFSGESGVSIESAQTMVTGGFSVKGNAAIKGHLTTDGSLSIPHLICPSMRSEATSNSSSKFATEGANYYPTNSVLKLSNFLKDLAFRYVMSGYIMSLQGITALVMEVYDLAMSTTMFDTSPIGTTALGIGTAFTVWGPAPVICFPPFGFVLNLKHNHTICGNDHSHTTTSPLASYWNTREAWGSERQGASPVPTVPPPYGDSPSPGPKSKPGACGGGGLYVKARNENYNLNIDNAFYFNNQLNSYLPIPISRTPDGNTFTTYTSGKGRALPPTYSRVYGVPSLTAVLCGPTELN